MAAIFVCCTATGTDFGTAEKSNKIIWIYFLQDWTPGEWLNILMYDTATYTRANVEKMVNSQVRLDARSDYSIRLEWHVEQNITYAFSFDKIKKQLHQKFNPSCTHKLKFYTQAL